MNTPAHLIFGLAAFGKPGQPRVTAAALAGALLPDLSLYLMAGTHLYILGTPARTVFDTLYFSPEWQAVFRIDNSVVLWGMGLALALMLRAPVAVAFCGAALLHLAGDFLLHNDDARAHFWPVTTWVFHSPVSYWDPRHYGRIAGAVEVLACVALSVWLWRRFTHRGMRALIVALALLEAAPALIFTLLFAHH